MKRTEHTQKWLDALRSGEYKQGRAFLRDSHDNYCCLGVLCDLVDSDTWQGSGASFYYHGGEELAAEPASCVLNAAGVHRGEMQRLIHLNDAEEYTFPQIADEIEKMLDVSN